MDFALPSERYAGNKGSFSVLGHNNFDVSAQWTMIYALGHTRTNGHRAFGDAELLEGLLDEGTVRPAFKAARADFHRVYATLRRIRSDGKQSVSPESIYATPMFERAITRAVEYARAVKGNSAIVDAYDLLMGTTDDKLHSFVILQESRVNVDRLKKVIESKTKRLIPA